MSKKEMPNAPRPTGADLQKKDYWVRDRITPGQEPKIWGRDMTYDDAWRLKESIAGARKSTTVRVEKMPAGEVPVGTTWDEATRFQAAQEAARKAATAAPPVVHIPLPPPQLVPDAHTDNEAAIAEALADAGIDEVDDIPGDDEIDDLIKEAGGQG